jgi:predicted dehydrogenase
VPRDDRSEGAPPVRLGVVGVGALVLRGVLPHLAQSDVRDSVVVEALCDPALERAETAARQYGVPKTYATLAALLADDAIDAVTLASPIGMHAEHGRLALEAGKHVHVNKTMSTTVAEADTLIALAERKGVRIVASPGEVLRPQLTRTRELIAEGAIGKLSWAICGCAFGRYHEQEHERMAGSAGAIDPSWYFKKPGGGPLYDMTAYALHGLTSVLGPAQRVTAMSGMLLPQREFGGRSITAEMDDNTVALLDFGGGVFAVAHGTAAGTVIEDFGAACYFGTEGEIRGVLLDGAPFDFPGRELTLSAPPTDFEVQMRVLPHVVGPHRELPESHVFEDVMQLVDWVRNGTRSPVTAQHARHVIDIIESIYRSAETGSSERLTTTFEWPVAHLVAA